MESSQEKSVRLPTFNGDDKNFQLWWMCFCVYARVYKFLQATKRMPDPDLPASKGAAIDATTEDGKKQIAAKKANKVCMANLTMAFTSEKLLGLIYKSVTADWLEGLAHQVINTLFKKYMPQDLIYQKWSYPENQAKSA